MTLNLKILLAVLVLLSSCVSHRHRPDPETVVSSADCSAVPGRYGFESEEDGQRLARLLFDADMTPAELEVSIDREIYEFNAMGNAGHMAGPVFAARTNCNEGILKTVLEDSGSASGVVMETSSLTLEMFVTNDGFLNLRFTDTTFAFLYLLPLYKSSDELIRLRGQAPGSN